MNFDTQPDHSGNSRSLLEAVWHNRIVNNRPIMWGGIAIGLSAISWVQLKPEASDTSHLETWGTASLPRFQVLDKQVGKSALTTYRANLEERIENSQIELSTHSSQALEAVVAQLEQNLANIKKVAVGQEELQRITFAAVNTLYARCSPAPTANTVAEQLVAQAGPEPAEPVSIVSYTPDLAKEQAVLYEANSIFEELTGAQIPRAVQVRFVDPALVAPHAGDCSEREQSIRVAGRSANLDLNTLLHEYGHLVCRQNEQSWDGSKISAGQSPDERRLRDEAAAKCFEVAAYSLPELLEESWLVQNSDKMIDASLSRDYSAVCCAEHADSEALKDAAIAVLGGAAQAFNHLSSASPIDSKITEFIEQNRIRFQELKRLEDAKKQPPEPALRQRIAELKREIDALGRK